MRYWAVFTMCLISIAVVESELNLGSAFSDEEVTRLLGNRRFIRHQIGCVLNKARCDKTGNQLKSKLNIIKIISKPASDKYFDLRGRFCMRIKYSQVKNIQF